MTTTAHAAEGTGTDAGDGAAAGRADAVRPEPGVPVVDVPVGRRVMVVGNLLLTPEATPSSTAASTELARALDAWEGPGILIVAGNLLDLRDCRDRSAAGMAAGALDAHPVLRDAVRAFVGVEGRRVIRQVGSHESGFDRDPEVVAQMRTMGVEHLGPVDLRLQTATGTRLVRVAPSVAAAPGGTGSDPAALPLVRATDEPWFDGLDRLTDPTARSRFVVSRTLYRRMGRSAWLLVAPFVVAVLLRVAITPSLLQHLGSGLPGRAIRHAHQADLTDQLLVAAAVALVVSAVLAVVLAVLSRRMWTILGGGPVDDGPGAPGPNDAARDEGRRLLDLGYAGLVCSSGFSSELTHLGAGFFATVGATTEVVDEHRGRAGLPPVFTHVRRVSWIELETGAELHVRLHLGQTDLPSPNRLERLVRRGLPARDLHPTLVASYPSGTSWPPAPDLRATLRRTRRVRRLAAALILVAGVLDLLDAVTPPLRSRLHLILQYLPLRASVAAGALLALAGLALVAMGRGILRGQRRAWRVAVVLLAGTVVLHLVAGLDAEESIVAAVILVLLVVNRREFQAASDAASLRSALVAAGVGTLGVALLATVSIELYPHIGRHHDAPVPWPRAFEAAAERLVGITTVPLPDRLDDFLAPALLAIGLAVAAVVLFLLTRPVVDRRMGSGRTAELRARDIVRRHGSSTLDYFALRSDKKWFFHRDSLVAYAVYGGVCLVSPDPIGPRNEREQTWAAFRRFADSHGWVSSVMGAGEEWLPVYRDAGMHHVYLGDEAVVAVQSFSLAGGHMKGLRQAHNRIKKYGYTVSFHDPARLDPALTDELTDLMRLSRQGEHERGFSMMLGRIFDPRDTGLLLAVVRAPDGSAAAMCQFVPAPGIRGYSLDLMRRDPGDHPNGLLDFTLCSTIEELAARGAEGLSLNFAALRSTLAGERGDGTIQKAERWVVKLLSNFGQIESLWRFNAKYDPEWLPRYVVFDAAEHLAAVTVAIVRAESLWEIPVLGRLLAAGAEKRMLAARRETEEALAAEDELAALAAGGPVTAVPGAPPRPGAD